MNPVMPAHVSSGHSSEFSSNTAIDRLKKVFANPLSEDAVLFEPLLKDIDSLPENLTASEGAELLCLAISRFKNVSAWVEVSFTLVKKLAERLPQESFWEKDPDGHIPLLDAMSAPVEVGDAIFDAMDLSKEQARDDLLSTLSSYEIVGCYFTKRLLQKGTVSENARGDALECVAARRENEFITLLLAGDHPIPQKSRDLAFYCTLELPCGDFPESWAPDLATALLIAPPGKTISNAICSHLLENYAEAAKNGKLPTALKADLSPLFFILGKAEKISDIDTGNALELFARSGNLNAVKLLLPHCKQDLRVIDAALYAAMTEHLDVVKYLLKSCQHAIQESQSRSALLIQCCANGWLQDGLEFVQLLLPPGVTVGLSKTLENAIQEAINLNAPDSHGNISEEVLQKATEFLELSQKKEASNS